MNELVRHEPRAGVSLAPRNLEEAIRLSELLAKSSFVPRDYQDRPGNVFVALQLGAEVGLGPMAALQSIAVIGNRPGLWGDGALAVVQTHPHFVSLRENVEGEGDERHGWCEIIRRGREMVRREFSVADAKRAKLWGKSGTWTEYPDRMLMMRARAFAMRDSFADALRGIGIVEELRDTPSEPREVPNLAVEPPAPRPTHPVQARADSLAEYAAGLAGREVQHPEPEAAEDSLPLIYFDGGMREIARGKNTGAPALVVWQRAAEREIAKAESAEALRTWRAAMGPHLGSIASLSPDHTAAVRQVERLVDERQHDFSAEPDAPPD
jgi:hypothetical protein